MRDENGRSWFYVIVWRTSRPCAIRSRNSKSARSATVNSPSFRAHHLRTRPRNPRPISVMEKLAKRGQRFRLRFRILYTCRGQAVAGSSPRSCRGTRPAELVFPQAPRGFWCRVQLRPFSTNRASPLVSVGGHRRGKARYRTAPGMKAQLDPPTGLYNASSARKRIEASSSTAPQRGMHVLAVTMSIISSRSTIHAAISPGITRSLRRRGAWAPCSTKGHRRAHRR